jgi:ribonuclease HI
MVSHRGIEANPDKVRAILEMPSPRTMKQLQQLTRRLAALNLFVSRSSDKCLPFFRVLKKAFSWTEECERAFGELKTYLANLPLLSRPLEGEILYLYLAVSRTGVSSVLVREESGKQRLVYFTSKVLHGAEERYPRIEKLAYALVISARRLRPYFQAHAVLVLTKYPLRKVLQKPDLSGRLVNWAIELGEFDIEYHPRTAVKAQALANFVVEMSESPDTEGFSKGPTWVAYVDGSSAGGGSGVGVVFRGRNREEFRYALKFDFPATNNEAEYEAILSAMEIPRQMGITNIEIRSDSQVIVEQINGSYATQETRTSEYLRKVHQFYSYFDRIILTKIPREKNGLADALSRIGSGTDPMASVSGCRVLIKAHPTVLSTRELMQVGEVDPEWATEIIRYLRTGELPSAKEDVQRVVRHSVHYVLVGGTLYRRGYSFPLLKCLPNKDADYVLREVHHGVCGNHSGAKALANKVIRAGYYRPMMNRDAAELVRVCDACQRFCRIPRSSPEYLHSITSPWPFSKWGVDIVGPLPTGKGNKKFVLVAVDYFTKWAEAEALATITTENVIKFLWKSIVCRFGIPYAMVTDNGKQFDCGRSANGASSWAYGRVSPLLSSLSLTAR